MAVSTVHKSVDVGAGTESNCKEINITDCLPWIEESSQPPMPKKIHPCALKDFCELCVYVYQWSTNLSEIHLLPYLAMEMQIRVQMNDYSQTLALFC